MNKALSASQRFITQHGLNLVYKSKGESVYNVETLSSASVDKSFTIKIYPKHIVANRQNNPDLIHKEVILFYLIPSGFIPKQGDKVSYKEKNFLVDSFQSHIYEGEVCLYKVMGYA